MVDEEMKGEEAGEEEASEEELEDTAGGVDTAAGEGTGRSDTYFMAEGES